MKIKIENYEIEGTPSEMVKLVSALRGIPQKSINMRIFPKSDGRCTSLTNEKKRCKRKVSSSFICSKTGLEIMTPGGEYCCVHHPESIKHRSRVQNFPNVPYYNPAHHDIDQQRESKRVLMENRIKYLEIIREEKE